MPKPPLRVGLPQIVGRGFSHRCPNCGARSLFGPLPHWFAVRERCSNCGLLFEREEGFFLGAMVISYTFTGLALIPAIVLVVSGALGMAVVIAALVAWCILFPLAFYRTSKSLWLMTYYLFVPRDLPANQDQPLHT